MIGSDLPFSLTVANVDTIFVLKARLFHPKARVSFFYSEKLDKYDIACSVNQLLKILKVVFRQFSF